jgi:hypothetical protein
VKFNSLGGYSQWGDVARDIGRGERVSCNQGRQALANSRRRIRHHRQYLAVLPRARESSKLTCHISKLVICGGELESAG